MKIVEGKTFRSGNSIAVRLPKDIAFAADIRVTIARDGDVLTIRPAIDPAAEKARVLEIVAALSAIGPADEIEVREPFDGPERPGLL